MFIENFSDQVVDPLSSVNEVNAGVFGMPDWLSWVIIAILLLVSALFSASENAFSNCNKYHFKVLADQGKITPKIIVRLTEKFEDTLVSVLVGNNIVQTLMSTISALLFYNLCRGWGFPEDSPVEAVLSTVVMAALVYIVSDTCPKILSKAIPNRMAYILAWPDFIISIILFPIILIFRGILKLTHKIFKIKDENILTKEDIMESVDEAITDENINNEEEQLFEPNEKKIFDRAFSFDTISVKQVLTKKENICFLNVDDLVVEKVNDFIMKNNFSRFPVYDENVDNVIGILSVNTYFKEYALDPHLDIRSCLTQPLNVSSDDKLDDIFDKLNQKKTHIAMVRDADNNLIGMVSMEDILDELVNVNDIISANQNTKKVEESK